MILELILVIEAVTEERSLQLWLQLASYRVTGEVVSGGGVQCVVIGIRRRIPESPDRLFLVFHVSYGNMLGEYLKMPHEHVVTSSRSPQNVPNR
jgi:hypothetical protein